MTWLLARLRETSTWRGLTWLLTAAGLTLRPEIWEQITAVGMAVAGLIGVLTREQPTPVEIRLPPIALVGRPAPAHPDRVPPGALDVPPGHRTAPDLDERNTPSGFNDR